MAKQFKNIITKIQIPNTAHHLYFHVRKKVADMLCAAFISI